MIRIILILIFNLIYTVSHASSWPIQLVTQSELKPTLMRLYQAHRFTFFCDLPYSSTGQVTIYPCEQCLPIEKSIKWMRLVPTPEYANSLSCYQHQRCVKENGKWYKGIACCLKQSTLFKSMHYDLHNFVPETPQLSQMRRQYEFELNLGVNAPCSFLFNNKKKKLGTSLIKLGWIARTYLYMDDTYGLNLSKKVRQQFIDWHMQSPPTKWEIRRNQMINQIQGNVNHWILAAHDLSESYTQ